MRRFYGSTGLFLALIVGSIALSQHAHADQNYNQNFGLYSSTSASTSTLYTAPVEIASATTTYIHFWGAPADGGKFAIVIYNLAATSTPAAFCTGDQATNQNIAIGNFFDCSITQNGLNIVYSSSTAAGNYEILLGGADSNGSNFYQSCTGPNPYAGVAIESCRSLANSWVDVGLNTSPSISFITPSDGSTIGPFYYWEIGTAFVDTSTPSFLVISSQFNGTNTLSFNDPAADGAIFESASSTQQIPAHLTPTAWASSTYYAMAGLFHSGSSTPYASTTIISFRLDFAATSTQNPNGTIPLGNPQPAPSSENCQYTSSTFFLDPVGNIREGICASLTFLFIPNSEEQRDLGTKFSNIGTSVSKKPPFGYFGAASNALSTVTSSTATTTLLNATSSAAIASVTAPLDSGLAAVIGFMTITWLFHRARHFEPT